ncbi:hypothetical protein PR001_g16989 [Phytophthora rubi]|uniref:Uncharacterized protein n=1 Tax=Phytophthora rubi TaxID=129364 RepID=A0A6A3KUA7_9STRA|nr:hypothetical protein PR001_g16989 [Phytophthora rubi]
MTNFEVGTTAAAKTTSVLELQRPFNDETTDSMLMLKTKLMMKVGSNYHDVASKEYLLRMKTNYDRGSLSGVIQATVHSVKHAVLLSRSKDQARTADEAVSAVCNRLTDVFASALGTIQFPPELMSDADAPSLDFSEARIRKAFGTYHGSVNDVHDWCRSSGIEKDPDSPVLDASHTYFGKTAGIPPLKSRFKQLISRP